SVRDGLQEAPQADFQSFGFLGLLSCHFQPQFEAWGQATKQTTQGVAPGQGKRGPISHTKLDNSVPRLQSGRSSWALGKNVAHLFSRFRVIPHRKYPQESLDE